jgi:predicted nucleic acid-binding protein
VAVVLDSAAIVALLDRDDALHAAADKAVRELMAKERLLASVVTFMEVLTGAYLTHHDEALVRGFFEEVIAEVLPVETEVAESAARLRAGHRSLRTPDALILASADVHPEVGTLLTGDAGMRAVRRPGLKVRLLSLR